MPSSVVTFTGELGSGKTTLISMLCRHLKILDPVQSPTFTYMNLYDHKIAHFDLYRIADENDFFKLGFEEYLSSQYITLIEWPDIINQYLPTSTISLKLEHHNHKRKINFDEKIFL